MVYALRVFSSICFGGCYILMREFHILDDIDGRKHICLGKTPLKINPLNTKTCWNSDCYYGEFPPGFPVVELGEIPTPFTGPRWNLPRSSWKSAVSCLSQLKSGDLEPTVVTCVLPLSVMPLEKWKRLKEMMKKLVIWNVTEALCGICLEAVIWCIHIYIYILYTYSYITYIFIYIHIICCCNFTFQWEMERYRNI